MGYRGLGRNGESEGGADDREREEGAERVRERIGGSGFQVVT